MGRLGVCDASSFQRGYLEGDKLTKGKERKKPPFREDGVGRRRREPATRGRGREKKKARIRGRKGR